MKYVVNELLKSLQMTVAIGGIIIAVLGRLFMYTYSEICGAIIKYYICLTIVALIEYAIRNMRR